MTLRLEKRTLLCPSAFVPSARTDHRGLAVPVSSRSKIFGRQASQAWGCHRRGAGGHRRRLLAFLVTFSRIFFGDVASCGCAPGCSTGLTLRARRGWSGAEFLAGKVRAMRGGIRGVLAAIAATRCPSLSCRHSPFVSCVACGVLRGLSRGHVCAVLVRYAGDRWIQSAGCLWWVRTVSPTCSAMSRTAVRLRSAATTARGERSLQKRMGGCRVNKMCVHIGFFAMSLAPPRHQPPSQL